MANCLHDDSEQWICVRILGSGAFGTVELWQHEGTQEQIAIKKSQANIQSLSVKQRERWAYEVDIMNKLKHFNIVNTKKLPEKLATSGNGLPILCMEYCNRGDLRNVLKNYENLCGVREKVALTIMHDVSSAVEYLHHCKITHRDLKPENIVMQQTKDRIVYKLIDLGYAKELGDVSMSASIVGTLNYLAPELLWKQRYSCSVDYWSLGILFYEIITGTRPFLPNMQLTKIWMDHVKGKSYEHICARQVEGHVKFFKDIHDPTNMSECLKHRLVQWFRVVLQWNPKMRGKFNESDEIVVFSMLKSIFHEKIIRTFIVTTLKFNSFIVNADMTIKDMKKLINKEEGINVDQQLITNSMGIILNDDEIPAVKPFSENTFFIFDTENICINGTLEAEIPTFVQEMLGRASIDCDYQLLKRYYGTTYFFINHELELYRSYILALGIMVDLCDARFKSLEDDIKQLISGTENLIKQIEILSKSSNLDELREKIIIFSQRTKRMSGEFQCLIQSNEELKVHFSNVNWTSEISEAYDNIVTLLSDWSSGEIPRTRKEKPRNMVKLVFNFLAARNKELSSKQLQQIAQNIMCLQKKLIKLEQVLKSFTALLNIYHTEVQKIPEKLNCSEDIIQSNSSRVNPDDSVIYDSIVIRNMVGGLLNEMDLWRRKYADLSNFDV